MYSYCLVWFIGVFLFYCFMANVTYTCISMYMFLPYQVHVKLVHYLCCFIFVYICMSKYLLIRNVYLSYSENTVALKNVSISICSIVLLLKRNSCSVPLQLIHSVPTERVCNGSFSRLDFSNSRPKQIASAPGNIPCEWLFFRNKALLS